MGYENNLDKEICLGTPFIIIIIDIYHLVGPSNFDPQPIWVHRVGVETLLEMHLISPYREC